MQKIIVIKIGTTSITKDCDQGINLSMLENLAKVSKKILALGHKVIIVSSGAMGLGLARLGADKLEKKLGFNPCKSELTSQKQALSSIGQIELMKEYQRLFAQEALEVGQVLITHTGIKDETRNSVIKETIEKMFELNIVPIVNANDTVSSKQIVSGDNDSLAARVAILLEAKRLLMLTDVAGLYSKDPNKHDDAELISEIEEVDEEIKELAGSSSSKTGTGGMRSKINAAEVCQQRGIKVDILDAKHTLSIDQLVLENGHNVESTTILPN